MYVSLLLDYLPNSRQDLGGIEVTRIRFVASAPGKDEAMLPLVKESTGGEEADLG